MIRGKLREAEMAQGGGTAGGEGVHPGRAANRGHKDGFKTGLQAGAGIEDFTFHDLNHPAMHNWRLQGPDYFRIMAASGYQTMSVFQAIRHRE